MDKKQRPIGVFDSGLGGISVLRELAALMPQENYIFYGDSKHAPYGTKTLEQVRVLTCEDAAHLAAQGVKALVVACNTATSAAMTILRETYTQMPVIGIEPALKPAVFVKAYPRVLVMATPMTLREQKFRSLMARFRERAGSYRSPAQVLSSLWSAASCTARGWKPFCGSCLRNIRQRRLIVWCLAVRTIRL